MWLWFQGQDWHNSINLWNSCDVNLESNCSHCLCFWRVRVSGALCQETLAVREYDIQVFIELFHDIQVFIKSTMPFCSGCNWGFWRLGWGDYRMGWTWGYWQMWPQLHSGGSRRRSMSSQRDKQEQGQRSCWYCHPHPILVGCISAEWPE